MTEQGSRSDIRSTYHYEMRKTLLGYLLGISEETRLQKHHNLVSAVHIQILKRMRKILPD